MADGSYDYGLDVKGGGDWVTGTFKWLLLKGSGYVFSKSHHYVSELVPASNEVTVGGYSRQTAAGKSRTVDTTNHRITYDCDDPAFGTLAAGETVSAMVLYLFVTNDADSILVDYYDLPDTPTNGTPFTVTLASTGTDYVDAA